MLLPYIIDVYLHDYNTLIDLLICIPLSLANYMEFPSNSAVIRHIWLKERVKERRFE